MDNEVELTELYDLDVQRHDGVAKPASGFSFLVTKSARQFAPGTCDCCPKCEGATGEGDCCEACKFTPGPTATTNTGTPNGVGKNGTMENETETAEKADEVEETSPPEAAEKAEETGAPELSIEAVQELIKAALAERDSEAESRIAKAEAERDAAKSELAVLKATPIPGGPAISATAEAQVFKAKAEAMQKAAYWTRLAETTDNRELAVEYTKRAKAAEAAAV